MRCARIERWISDEMDGALTPGQKKALARHLASCPSCRAYRLNLENLQAGASKLNRGAERPDAYWRDFDARLAARLRREPPSVPARLPLFVRRPWAWGGVGLAAAAALAAYFVFIRPVRPAPGPFVFSFEDTIASIMTEIGDNPELESSFALALQASIDEAIGGEGEGALGSPSDDPLFWEGLSDDDLARIESVIRNEKRS